MGGFYFSSAMRGIFFLRVFSEFFMCLSEYFLIFEIRGQRSLEIINDEKFLSF